MRGKLAFLAVIIVSFFISINNIQALSKTKITGKYYYSKAAYELELINKERRKYGLDDLIMDEDLFNSANIRAAEIVLYMNKTHYRPNGKAYNTISSKVKGENTGYIYGYNDVEYYITKSWMNSESHRKNILDKKFKTIGIGCFKYNDTYYFVQQFGYDDLNEIEKYPKDKKKTVTVEHLDNIDKKGVTFDKPIYEIKDTGYITLTKYNMDTKYTIFKSNNNIKLVEEDGKIKVTALKSGITQVLIKYANGEYASTFIITGNNTNNIIDNEYIKVCGTTYKIDADIKPIDTLRNYIYGIKDTKEYNKYNNKIGDNLIISSNNTYILNLDYNTYNLSKKKMDINNILSMLFNNKENNNNITFNINNTISSIKYFMI